MNNITKKLQKLAEQRGSSIVVTKQGSIKKYSRSSSSTSYSDYSSGNLEDT